MNTRSLLITALLCLPTPSASAQHTTEVAQVQTLSTCVTAQQTQLARVTRLMDEARTRMSSTDATVRHDAELSIDTLLQRAAEARDAIRACIVAADFEPPSGETVEHTTTADSAADHVAQHGTSIHEVEANAAVTRHVRIVRGERVDGSGATTDSDIRAAVHGAGGAISACYDGYVDRASSRSGTVHVSFTVNEGGGVTAATVERGGFDAPLRQCVQHAISTVHVTGAHGRSVYAYEIALGE